MANPQPTSQITNLQSIPDFTKLDRLKDFTTYFVKEVETKLHTHYLILEGEVEAKGEFTKTVGEAAGKYLGIGLGLAIGCSDIFSELGKFVGKEVGNWIGKERTLKETLMEHNIILSFKDDSSKFRERLVEAAFDVFQSFEMQFMNVTSDQGPKKAMQLLSRDAANRAINYFKQNTFRIDGIAESVLCGISQVEPILEIPISSSRIKKPGFKVIVCLRSSDFSTHTSCLFDKVGIVIEDRSSTQQRKYYENKKGKNKPGRYGFRRLLSSETWSDMEGQYVSFDFEKRAKYKEYSYITNVDMAEVAKEHLLKHINESDSELSEERMITIIKESKDDISQQLSDLMQQCKSNQETSDELRQIRNIIQRTKPDHILRKLEDCLDKIIQYNNQIQKVADVCHELKTDVGEINKKLIVQNNANEKILLGIDDIKDAIEENIQSKIDSVWFDMKDPVNLFTGRSEELIVLHNKVQRCSKRGTVISQMTSISGLGGIGKTELARKYAHQHREDYDENVVWINAEDRVTLMESFGRLAKDKLRIRTKNIDGVEKDINSIVAEVYNFFKDRKVLFIFDNAEVSEDINEFLPLRSLSPGHNRPYILITSRNREWESDMEVLGLDELKLEDAITLVRLGLEIENDNQADEIKRLVEKLQCFPLALHQAIAYIKDERKWGIYTIENYLEEYEKKAQTLLDSKVFKGIDNDYTKTTFTTWEITLDKIACDKENGPLALKILETIAYLSPENINRNIFIHFTNDNERRMKIAVRLLVKYSLVNANSNQYILSIHRLVQETTRLKLREQCKYKTRLENVLELIKENLVEDHIDHAMIAWNHACEEQELVKKFSYLLSRIIDVLRSYGRFQEAYSFGTASVKSLKQLLSDDHPDILSSEFNIAEVIYRQGKYDEALEHYRQVLSKQKNTHGEDHPITLTTFIRIAVALNNKGEYTKTLEMCDNIINKKGDTYDSQRVSAMHEKARALDYLGNYREAIHVFKDVLQRHEQISSPYRDILYSRHGLGRALSNQGELEEALSTYETIAEERNRILPPDHPDTLATMNNIAVVFNKQGRYDEAIKLYKDVLQKRNKVLGERHPSTLYTLHGIGKVFNNKGEYEEASNYLQDVFTKRKETLGYNYASTLSTRNECAVLMINQGKYREALEALHDIYKTRKDYLGEDHPSTLSTQHEIAEALKNDNKDEEALKCFQDVCEKRIYKLGENHPSTLNTRHCIAEVMLKDGKLEEAMGTFQDVYGRRTQKLGEDHPSTLHTRHCIAEGIVKEGKTKEALDIFMNVYKKRKIKLGEDHPSTLTTRHSIAEVMSKDGENKEALEMFRYVYEKRKIKLGDHPHTLATRQCFTELLLKEGKTQEDLNHPRKESSECNV